MRTVRKYLIAVGKTYAVAYLLLAVLSCSKELKLPNSDKPPKIVLIGELIADSSIEIRVGQTMTLSSTAAQFGLPIGASVNINDGTKQIPLSVNFDQLTFNNTIPYLADDKIGWNKTYQVTASHEAMGTATASVRIPNPIIAMARDTVSVMYGGSRSLQVTIDIQDPPAEINYYVLEVLEQQVQLVYDDWGLPPDTVYVQGTSRRYIHTNDERSENYINGSTQTQSRRVFFTDKHFSGRTLTTDLYISDDVIYNGNEYELLILKVKSVSEEYYNFLKAYEEYEPAGGFNTNNAPVKMDGNVMGGMGMVGGVSQQVFRYVVPASNTSGGNL